jgi:hypothetical protein
MEDPRIEVDIPSGVSAKLLYSKSKVFIKPSANLKIPGILAIADDVSFKLILILPLVPVARRLFACMETRV